MTHKKFKKIFQNIIQKNYLKNTNFVILILHSHYNECISSEIIQYIISEQYFSPTLILP